MCSDAALLEACTKEEQHSVIGDSNATAEIHLYMMFQHSTVCKWSGKWEVGSDNIAVCEVCVSCQTAESCRAAGSPDVDFYCCSSEEPTAINSPVKQSEMEPLEQLDITKYLVFRKADEEGPDVRGGHPDALIIHATKANKNGELWLLDSIAVVFPLLTKF